MSNLTAENVRLCPVCDWVLPGLAPGPAGRPNARCRRCHSLERHRSLALILRELLPRVSDGGVALEVAPSTMFHELLSEGDQVYVGLDFDPAADGRTVNVQASLTDLPLSDKSVDVGLVYHVLEHVPDDESAMRELARTLSDTGIIFVQVPWRPDAETDEDLSVTDPEERTRRFGQFDHVRYYGRDFDDRLAAAGVSAHRLLTREIFPSDAISTFGLISSEPIWICAASSAGAAEVADHLRSWGPRALSEYSVGLLATLENRRADFAQQNAKLSNRVNFLEDQVANPVSLRRRARRKAGRLKRELLRRNS